MKRIYFVALIAILLCLPLFASDDSIVKTLKLIKQNDFQNARLEINKYLIEHPDDEVAKYILFRIPEIEKKYSEYKKLEMQSVELSPSAQKEAEKILAFAKKIMERGEFSESIEVLKKLDSAFPGYKQKEVYFLLSKAFLLAGHPKESLSYLEKYRVLLGRETDDYLYLLGQIYLKTGQITAAKVNFIKLLSSEKYSSSAAKYLQEISLN